MVQDPDRVDEVEGSAVVRPRERRVVDVALDDVHVGHLSKVGVRGFDGIAQVHGHDLSRTVLPGVVGVPTVPATCVEHDLVAKEVGLNGMDPVEELRLVLVVELDELLPLPAESRGRPLDDRRQARGQQPRDAVAHGEPRGAGKADELARLDLAFAFGVGHRVAKLQPAAARWAREHVHQPRLHDGLRATHRSEAPKGMSVRRRIGISDSKILRRMPFDHAGCRSFSVSYSWKLRRTFSHWRPRKMTGSKKVDTYVWRSTSRPASSTLWRRVRAT